MSCDKKQKMKIKFGTILISDVINLIGRHCNAIDLINLRSEEHTSELQSQR